jgi:hypothetical protein
VCRYGFLQVPTLNCDSPDQRNRDAVTPASSEGRIPSSQSSIGSSGEKGPAPAKRKRLAKSKDEILITTQKWDEEKITAKEMEQC